MGVKSFSNLNEKIIKKALKFLIRETYSNIRDAVKEIAESKMFGIADFLFKCKSSQEARPGQMESGKLWIYEINRLVDKEGVWSEEAKKVHEEYLKFADNVLEVKN